MIPYERQQKILNIIEGKELIRIDELQEMFPEISASTLRRDIKELEKNRKIESLAGGAIKKASTVGEIPITTRSTFNSESKEKIATIAAELVQDGDTIYLDSGSTCLMLFKKIMHKKIIIYTSNTDVFSIKENFNAEIIILGGNYNPVNSSILGSLTENLLKNLYFNKSFLGANGIDESFGITTPSMEEANKKRLVKEHSDHSYILCDSSKFHKLSNVKVFDLNDVVLISDKTDDRLSKMVSILVE